MNPLKVVQKVFVPLALILPPILIFANVTIGKNTLVPTENLIEFEPWKSSSDVDILQSDQPPHNALLSDLVLQNYVWQNFIRESLNAKEIPLWNPYLFGGTPFLANAQHSMLYPFSILFHILPISKAYGWFIVSQYIIAGISMYLFCRSLKFDKWSCLTASTIYQISLFMIVSAVFPMIVAGAAWLPTILLSIDGLIYKRTILGKTSHIPWICIGAIAIGLQILAGHPEVVAYSLLIVASYSSWHLLKLLLKKKIDFKMLVNMLLLICLIVSFGLLLSAIQLFPLIEAASNNFREESASLSEVQQWGYPYRRIITMLVPNFFGNPTHYQYLDMFSWDWKNVAKNSHGENTNTIDWGIKNYVEGGIYLGILPILLTIIALINYISRKTSPTKQLPDVGFWLIMTILCLGFIFGTPLYALIYYLPSLDQLHSPFRWSWPLSLCISLLSASTIQSFVNFNQRYLHRTANAISKISIFSGIILLTILFVSYIFFNEIDPILSTLLSELSGASTIFSGTQMFFSYEARWLLQCAILLVLSGWIIQKINTATHSKWKFIAWLILVTDLIFAGYGFNSNSNPDILNYKPDIVEFLEKDKRHWRFTTYDPNGDKILNANSAWLFRMKDIRGYDSIIPKQYVDYMNLIEPQNLLQYNRISPITTWKGLHSPLLDLLNVKYIVTNQNIDSPEKFTLIYENELFIYENNKVLPRVYTLPESCIVFNHNNDLDLTEYDPHHLLVLESADNISNSNSPNTSNRTDCNIGKAKITTTKSNKLEIYTEMSQPGYVVVTDSFDNGWQAYVQNTQQISETKSIILRAHGNFRAIPLEKGSHTIRLIYSPLSFRIGSVFSAISIILLIILFFIWIWHISYKNKSLSRLNTIAKNSIAPMGFNLLNRSVDFIFAMFYLRMLGPAEAGNYATAIVLVGWLEIWANFGLNTWLTREASKNLTNINQFFANSTILRIGLLLITMPIFLGAIYLYEINSGLLGQNTILAIVLLSIGMLFSTISTGITAVFYAFEKAEYPAAISSFSTILKVILGLIALILGYGFVGLAGASIIVNILTLSALIVIIRKLFFKPQTEFNLDLQKQMVSESFPLMINHLLATLFFKVDIPMIRTMRGQSEVGRYSTAYKFIEAFNIVPSFFTFAIFPLMSQQANTDKKSLIKTYHFAIKLLVVIAIPIAIITSTLAPFLITILGGEEFLPTGAIALQIMVWSIPFGWINSVTNYLLVAINQVRKLTNAFLIATIFNIVVNIIFIPIYGFYAAAISTILSELLLGILFQSTVYKQLSPTPFSKLFGRILMAATLLVTVIITLSRISILLSIIIGICSYLSIVLYVDVFNQHEKRLMLDLLPKSIKNRLKLINNK